MVRERLQMVFTSEELARIAVNERRNCLNVTVDVHGLRCWEARRLLNNVINLLPMKLQLIVIHGYNHGTAIKNMLATDFRNTRVSENRCDNYNQGVTHLLVS